MTDFLADLPIFVAAIWQTLYMVIVSLIISGFLGLAMGVGLYVTRPGNLLANRAVFAILNLAVNIVRPIPFIIFLAAAQPLARAVVGTGIGNSAIIFTLSLAAMFGISRIVEQNLLTVQPGVIERSEGLTTIPRQPPRSRRRAP